MHLHPLSPLQLYQGGSSLQSLWFGWGPEISLCLRSDLLAFVLSHPPSEASSSLYCLNDCVSFFAPFYVAFQKMVTCSCPGASVDPCCDPDFCVGSETFPARGWPCAGCSLTSCVRGSWPGSCGRRESPACAARCGSCSPAPCGDAHGAGRGLVSADRSATSGPGSAACV